MRALSLAFQSLFVVAALLSGSAGTLVMASLFVADRRPETSVSLAIHLFVGGAFLALGLVLTGIMLQVAGLATIMAKVGGVDAAPLRKRLVRLLVLLVISRVCLCAMLALIAYGILARTDQGFAVFG